MSAKLNSISPTQMTMWWFPVVVGSVVVLGTILVLLPKVQKIFENREAIKIKQEKIAALQLKNSALEKLDIDKINRFYDLVNAGLPNDKPFFEVIGQLQVESGRIGVVLGDFDINPGSVSEEAGKDPKSQQVAVATSLVVKGTYEKINEFLDAIQKTLPLYTVTKVSFSTSKEDTTTANLSIEVYYQPINEQTNINPESPLPKLTQASEEALSILDSYSTAEVADVPVLSDDFKREDIFNF